MNAKVNIYADEWCDLVFIGKNQAYGAYENRKNSDKRHALALLISIVLVALAVAAPTLIKAFIPKSNLKNTDGVILSNIILDPPPPEPLTVTPPPPPLRSTIRFTPYEITDKDVVDESKTQDEIIQSRTAISIADITGTDPEGADIADLRKIVTEEKKDVIYQVVEQNPQFPGGNEALAEFLSKNILYPDAARESGIAGRVYIQFVVDKYGHIGSVKLTRGIGGGCDEEALRVVKKMPAWAPGKQNGQAVAVYFNLPVVFRLAE
jgi:periplasmic protein TonB